MKIFRDVNGFSIQGKACYVRVEMVIIDGVRHAKILEGNDPWPTYIQPSRDCDLYRVAYRVASQSARYEFHPHG